jgi:formylglycine-generating enzyme
MGASVSQPFGNAQVAMAAQLGMGALGTIDLPAPDAMSSDGGVVHVPGLDAKGACPAGMVLVEGEACTEVEHVCLREMKDDPAHRCLEFKPGADQCIASRGKLKFCMDRYEWPGTPGAQPRVLVDYFEAERSCKSVGKRMCKEDEFYLACEGPEHWPYAWGHVRHPSPCNIDRPYLMVDWQKWAKGREAMTEEARRLDQALPIGSSKCWSPYGIHDIAGNVDEWTTSRPGRELEGSLNGGYWGPVQNACRYVTLVHGPEFLFYQIGFRCCSDSKSSQ